MLESSFFTWDNLSGFAQSRAINNVRKKRAKDIAQKVIPILKKKIILACKKVSNASNLRLFNYDGMIQAEIGISLNSNILTNLFEDLKEAYVPFIRDPLQRSFSTIVTGIGFILTPHESHVLYNIYTRKIEDINGDYNCYEELLLNLFYPDIHFSKNYHYSDYINDWAKNNNWSNIQRLNFSSIKEIHQDFYCENNFINHLYYGNNPSNNKIEILPPCKNIYTYFLAIDEYALHLISEYLYPLLDEITVTINSWNFACFNETKIWTREIIKNPYLFTLDGDIVRDHKGELLVDDIAPFLNPLDSDNKPKLENDCDFFTIFQLDPKLSKHNKYLKHKSPFYQQLWLKNNE